MENLKETTKKLLEFMNLNEPAVDVDPEGKKITIFVNEGDWFRKLLPQLINDFEHILRLIARKNNQESIFVDINNYRKEREGIIIELAKAAARKSLLNKEAVELPSMNAYERRLVHLELSTRRMLKPKALGREGKDEW